MFGSQAMHFSPNGQSRLPFPTDRDIHLMEMEMQHHLDRADQLRRLIAKAKSQLRTNTSNHPVPQTDPTSYRRLTQRAEPMAAELSKVIEEIAVNQLTLLFLSPRLRKFVVRFQQTSNTAAL